MKGYIITDFENKARCEHVNKCLEAVPKECGLEFEGIEAIMAKRMALNKVYENVLMPTFLSPGEIGCALSHLTIYRKMIKNNIPYALILEDDAKFHHLFLQKDTISELEKFIISCDSPSVLVLQKSIYHNKKVFEGANFSVYTARNLFCAHGYIVNLEAAKNILAIQTPIHFEIDAFKFYYYLDACQLYCLDTELIGVEDNIASASLIKDAGGRVFTSKRHQMKNANFHILYKALSYRGKANVWMKRLNKLIHKKNESLDY